MGRDLDAGRPQSVDLRGRAASLAVDQRPGVAKAHPLDAIREPPGDKRDNRQPTGSLSEAASQILFHPPTRLAEENDGPGSGIGLKEFEEFFNISLEPKLVPAETGSTSSTNHKKEKAKKNSPRPVEKPTNRLTGDYTSFAQSLPPIIQKVGARNKKFTTADLAEACNNSGMKNFKPGWISTALIVGKMKGVVNVGKVQRDGKPPMNQYQLNGKPVQVVKGKSRKS